MDNKLEKIFDNELSTKIKNGLLWTAKYSIYPVVICIDNINVTQEFIMGMFYSLRSGDLLTATSLLEASIRLPQLGSTFVSTWLVDDFSFDRKDVVKCLESLAQLVNKNYAYDWSLVSIFLGLEKKYNLIGYFNHNADIFRQSASEIARVQVQALSAPAVEKPALDASSSMTDVDKIKSVLKPQKRASEMKPAAVVQPMPATSSPVVKISVADDLVKSADKAIRINKKEDSELMVPFISKCLQKAADVKLLDAVKNGDEEAVKEALEAGARPNSCSWLGQTPLHCATAAGYHDLVRVLLLAGASQDLQDSDGWTALHYAALSNRVVCAKMLLNSGARPNIRDILGKTPLKVAVEQQHIGIASLIKSRGGDLSCVIS